MKRLLFLLFACSMMQLSAQNMLSQSKSSSLVQSIATSQVENLTKKLNLNESQQKMTSKVIVDQLKSDAFKKFLKEIDADKLIASEKPNDVDEKIQNALLLDRNFQKGMGSILDPDQMKAMKNYIPK